MAICIENLPLPHGSDYTHPCYDSCSMDQALEGGERLVKYNCTPFCRRWKKHESIQTESTSASPTTYTAAEKQLGSAATSKRVSDHCKASMQSEATAKAATPHEPPGGPPNLFSIPQDLRDKIFYLAYALGEDVHDPERFYSHIIWDDREKARQRRYGPSHVPVRFKHSVDNLMVSKAFFTEAARAFVTNRIEIKGHMVPFADSVQKLNTGIVYAYLTSAELDYSEIARYALTLPNLRFLRVKLNFYNFEDAETDCAARRPLTSGEIRALETYRDILEIKSLRRFEAADGELRVGEIGSPFQKVMWALNLQRFERRVNEALAPRARSAHVRPRTPGTCETLYAGSLVCSTHSPRKRAVGTRVLEEAAVTYFEHVADHQSALRVRFFRPCMRLGPSMHEMMMREHPDRAKDGKDVFLEKPDELMTDAEFRRWMLSNAAAVVEFVWVTKRPASRKRALELV